MNKYQEYLLLKDLKSGFMGRCCAMANESGDYGSFDKTTDTLIITQDEDINIIDYALIIDRARLVKDVLEGIYILENGVWKKIELCTFGNNQALSYRVPISFNNRAGKLRFIFKNRIADDYILNLKYIEADKEKYYVRCEQRKKDELQSKAHINHSTGNDLVNIYFQPCCEEYIRTEIALYKDGMLIAKYKVDECAFFKCITALAYGSYEYVVKQFDKENVLLFETEKIPFTIKAPRRSNWMNGGRNTVVI